MKHGISFLRGPALAGAVLLGSGCIVSEATRGGEVQIVMDISKPDEPTCTVSSTGEARTCNGVIATSGRAMVDAIVDWNRDEPGSFVVMDDCGGRFEVLSSSRTSFRAEWVAPVVPGACVLTAQATGTDGATSELSTVITVQGAGPAGFPRLSAKLSHGNGACVLAAGQASVSCEPISATDIVHVSLNIDWGTLTPGVMSVSPTCSGQFVDPVNDGSSYQAAWEAPHINATGCEVTLEAISNEGPFTVATMSYAIVGGQPPGEVYAYGFIEHSGGRCMLDPGELSTGCPAASGGERALVYVEVDWGNHDAGSIVVRDTCNGGFATRFSSATNRELDWLVPADASTCTVQIEATTATGELRIFEMLVPVN